MRTMAMWCLLTYTNEGRQYFCSCGKLSLTLLWIHTYKQLINCQYVANIKLRGRPYSVAGSNQSVWQDFTFNNLNAFGRCVCRL